MLPNVLSQRAILEFQKTAEAVGKPPWHLLKAQAYLEALCDRNQRREAAVSQLQLNFVFNYKMATLKRQPGYTILVDHHKPPREVRIVRPDRAELRRRLKRKHDSEGPAVATRNDDPEDEKAEEEEDNPEVGEGSKEAQSDAVAANSVGSKPMRVFRRPAAAAVKTHGCPRAVKTHGCPRSRYGRIGCSTCRQWAREEKNGRRFGVDGKEVLIKF